ncbi:helix-turn-helix transcriptional regulator [Ornithinibacillus bavariensis]|uniref:helix-turn-helix transcriptional regulator n=1 Tax=Ornithinibacillus bavariensis TaxID=545502 RepID=UPI003D200B49
MTKIKRAKLVSLRKQKSWSQKDVVNILSKEYGINITDSYYGMIEQGARNPTLRVGVAISKIFNVDIDDIFFEPQHNKMLC